MTQFDSSATSQPHSRSTMFVFMRKTNTCTVFLLNESMSLNKARIQLKSKAKHLTFLQIEEIFQLQPKDSCNKVSTLHFGINLYHYPTSILRFCKLKCPKNSLVWAPQVIIQPKYLQYRNRKA